MKAIIWYLVFWGLYFIDFKFLASEEAKSSPKVATIMVLIWLIPFVLYLRQDLRGNKGSAKK